MATDKVDAKKFYGENSSWDWEQLEDHEKVWARDHGLLNPAQEEEISHLGVTFGLRTPDVRVSNDPNFIAEQQLAQSGFFDQMVEERAKEMARQMLIAEQQGRSNVAGGENTGRAGNAPVPVDPGVAEAFQPVPARRESQGGETEDAPPYEEWNNDDLRKECKARGLNTQGSKGDLVARLEEDDDSAESSQSEGAGGSGEGS